ncbi:hypothetical protein F4678DRAFT_477449 [Xylaria arbuscula]|nr:hypothetical protein F4678DRAFT_477449 [Xylaria arbuscula]
MELGIVADVLVPIDLPGYGVVLDGLKDLLEYGKLLSLHAGSSASDEAVAMRRYCYDPGAALLVLEAQQRLLDFLSGCCSQILPSCEVPGPVALDLFIPPDSLHEDTRILKDSRAGYRLDRIESLMRGRLFQARDHVWLLREDSAYFQKHFSEIQEIQLQLYRNYKGDKDAELPLRHSVVACITLITHAYHTVDIFEELHQQAEALRQMVDHYKTDLSHIEELPEELRDAILRLRYYLTKSVDTPVIPLQQDLPVSPNWLSMPQDDSLEMGRVEEPMISDQQWFIWLLKQISAESWRRFLTIPLLITELERMFYGHDSPWPGLILGTRFQSLLGDVSLMSQCISELENYVPRGRGFKPNFADGDDTLKSNYMERFDRWRHIRDTLSDDRVKELKTFAAPLREKSFHSHIAKFWTVADDIMDKRFQLHADSLVKQLGNQAPEKEKTQDTQPTRDLISVRCRARHVFYSLFYNPPRTPKPHRLITWSNIKKAMVSTGLITFEILFPRICIFQMSDDNRTVIVFDQERPIGRSRPLEQLMRDGRRLNKAFGWTYDTFVLKKG